MRTHDAIDRRSLELARAVVEIIDRDPSRSGLERARENCRRWLRSSASPAIAQWRQILEQDWSRIRLILVDEGENGASLRQSSPFCGVLSPKERWAIFKRWSDDQRAV
jgi:hypothetical protein